MVDALDIRVRGIVQGVGFRPFVYRLAKRHLVAGWVLNDRDGVFIHAEAETRLLDEFVTELHMNPPVASKISELELAEVPLQDCEGFEIRESRDGDASEVTLVSADLGVCDDCLRELYDPSDRRFRYPFINCTNCGPRFTIIDELPYDRPVTSMRSFAMCDRCASEYGDPADRRFHAQPDACFDCGPHISFWQPGGDVEWAHDRKSSDDIIARSVLLLGRGGILAVKGLGGFHLVCDATNERAIAELRRRKRRDGKALAVMVATVADAREACEVSAAEEGRLTSAARPIVLLKKRVGASIAPGLADGLPELGVMLPSTPLQSLLLHDLNEATGAAMLVMTSGNVHDEPIVTDDGEARDKLGTIADAVIGNDRPILSRYDDSVIRVLRLGDEGAVQFVRRARGYAPVPLQVKRVGDGSDEPSPAVLATGSEQKNTFTFMRGEDAYVSQHVGDLEDADVYDAWLEAKGRMEKLFELEHRMLACDAHPEYLASKWARDEALRSGSPLVEVQHHHAHIASVLGEHGLYGPCCGIAFDGTGYGADGAIWGGEVLVANQADYERFANFSYVPMPGGAAAVKNPLRMAYGLLWAYDLLDHPAARDVLDALGEQAGVCDEMIEKGVNTPYTSSVGRMFDAVSAILGVCPHPSYEGEAAILLDAARGCAQDAGGLSDAPAGSYEVAIAKNAATDKSTAHDTSVVLFDAEPVIRGVLDDKAAGVPVSRIALKFHNALVGAVVRAAELARAMYDISLVVLSGGCFMNRYLVERSVEELHARGFTVALNGDLPPNDGCISLGQAVVARASR